MVDAGGGHDPAHLDRADEIRRQADGGETAQRAVAEGHGDAAHGVEQQQRHPAMGDAVVAHVALVDLELEIDAVPVVDLGAVADQLLERAGQGPDVALPRQLEEPIEVARRHSQRFRLK